MPRIPGIEHAITSDEAFHLERFPERAVIVGGGYIAVEFAGIFHGMGASVTQLYRGPLFMRGFDDDVRRVLADQMRRHTKTRPVLVKESDVEALRKRGAARLITTTPSICGESFGTNVMEGVLVALSGKQPEELAEEDYLEVSERMNWKPGVTDFG